MKNKDKKENQKKISYIQHEENRLKTARNFNFGNGAEVTVESENNTEWYYTSKLPDLGTPTKIEVELVSTEKKDLDLLHHLLEKTRNNKNK